MKNKMKLFLDFYQNYYFNEIIYKNIFLLLIYQSLQKGHII